ncbi:ETC complex I subunit [Marinosulfonomonas sp. PRT-SC04]|nr:ETC complex I subunit [Marinosulfonomonas sp. PRT-SC04]
MLARIYQPSQNAMQSGVGKNRQWVLEFAPEAARTVDPLMGWTSSTDMDSQVRLNFDDAEAAIGYAKAHGIDVQVTKSHKRKPVIRQGGYGENFSTYRRGSWTH